jgi:hypothetical protein
LAAAIPFGLNSEIMGILIAISDQFSVCVLHYIVY